MNAALGTQRRRIDSATGDDKSAEDRIARALEEYAAAVEAGRPLSRDQLLAAYPDVAAELAGCLDSLDFIRQVAPQLQDDAPTGAKNGGAAIRPLATLGDFRIVRELGRGGMGVVYEAEQLSIGRRVALKVLPFAAMLDKQQLNRFKNEARAAGTLDHPNIVAIHSVGVERGVHYYAMQLIEGESLAQVIARLRKESGVRGQESVAATAAPTPPPSKGREQPSTADPKSAERRAVVGSEGRGGIPDAPTIAHQPSDPPASSLQSRALPSDTAPVAALSTRPDANPREYFRTIARLGVQAAEALDHAHANGILHRDVKPANLMVECSHLAPKCSHLAPRDGNHHAERDDYKLWITDFGLARIEQDAGMTMTGDLIGTLRYMSPEQALAKRVVVDHRSDIYSLGVTLYELLTLEPMYEGHDRQELLRQIAFEEPRKLRQINPRIPQDLETIVLKATEKNAGDRYATSHELAVDLQAFLSNMPITAQTPSLWSRGRKMLRRNPTVLVAAILLLVLTSTLMAISAFMISRERDAAVLARNEATAHLKLAHDAIRTYGDACEHLDLAAELATAGFNEQAQRMCLQGCQEFREYLAVADQIGERPSTILSPYVKTISVLDHICQKLYDAGFTHEATEIMREQLQIRSRYFDSISDPTGALAYQAIVLACWPDVEIRNGGESRKFAMRALATPSPIRGFDFIVWHRWGVLAFAHLCDGDAQSAIDAMEKSIALGEEFGRTASAMDWLLFAKANWQLGNKEEARTWYAKALQRLELSNWYERHFHEEVAVLLGEPVDRQQSKKPSE